MNETSNKSFTQAELNETAREMVKKCLFENNEKDYLNCCSKPESECTIESKPNFSSISKETNYYEIISLGVILLIIIGVIYFFIKKQLFKKLLPPYKKESKAIFYGWLVWGLCIFSYENLFDEYVEYGIWLTLPPLCTIAIYFWFKSFILKSSNKANQP